LLLSTACGGAPTSDLTDRLWVSSVPKGPRESTHAFAMTKVRGRQLGSFYSGSIYAGKHQMFAFESRARGRGRITLLQENRAHEVTVTTCQPTRGFDFCILLEGDPTNTVRYQSRKRWTIPRRRSDAAPDPAELLETFALAGRLLEHE
jgi:hypothetical protein